MSGDDIRRPLDGLSQHDCDAPSSPEPLVQTNAPTSGGPSTGSRFRPWIGAAEEFLLDDELDAVIVGRDERAHSKYGERGLMAIGTLSERSQRFSGEKAVRVLVDCMEPHVICVSGMRGGGKSMTVGVMAEELLRTGLDLAVVIFDPVGVHASYRRANRSESDAEVLAEMGLVPQRFARSRVVAPPVAARACPDRVDEVLALRPADMTSEDWCLFWNLSTVGPQRDLLDHLLRSVAGGYQTVSGKRVPGKSDFGLEDLLQCVGAECTISDSTSGFVTGTRRSIAVRLAAANNSGLFRCGGMSLANLAAPGMITVVDLSYPSISAAEQAAIVGLGARKIYEARSLSRMTGTDLIPVTWLILEEAHNFIPASGSTGATSDLVTFAKQGRRPGCGLVVCTQEPAATNAAVQSQADIVISHSLCSAADLGALKACTPAMRPPEIYGRDGLLIRRLPPGYAVLADKKTQVRPFVLRVRPRLSQHDGSSSVPAPRQAHSCAWQPERLRRGEEGRAMIRNGGEWAARGVRDGACDAPGPSTIGADADRLLDGETDRSPLVASWSGGDETRSESDLLAPGTSVTRGRVAVNTASRATVLGAGWLAKVVAVVLGGAITAVLIGEVEMPSGMELRNALSGWLSLTEETAHQELTVARDEGDDAVVTVSARASILEDAGSSPKGNNEVPVAVRSEPAGGPRSDDGGWRALRELDVPLSQVLVDEWPGGLTDSGSTAPAGPHERLIDALRILSD